MEAANRLRPPPQTQALSSTTFRPPPLDGQLTLPEIYEWHAEHSPNHRLFTFAREDGTIRDIYWPEAVAAAYVGAKIVADRLADLRGLGEPPIVAILSHSDAIPYFITFVSIMYANCIVFPISPRNSPAAVAHLIQKVGVKHVLVGQEQSMHDLSSATLEILKTQYPSTTAPGLSPMPLFHELFLPASSKQGMKNDVRYVNHGSDAVVMIMHSSGSTAYPKPIYFTNRRATEMTLTPWFGERDLTGVVWSLHTMPMYHGMGGLQIFWTASCGSIISAFEPRTPVPIPTPDTLFQGAKATNSDLILCVPSVIEAWTRKPSYVKWLATRTGVVFGGGPLNKEAGDYMTSQGVSVFNLYGSTEGGIISPIIPKEVGYDWIYFYFPAHVRAHMAPYGDNTFEFVIIADHFNTPSVLNTKVDGVDAYATSDLMIPHPTKAGYWRVHGRTDDQIMHNTGEKTNPGPLESILNQDPHVLSSVMFGRGRFQAGVLVDPRPQYKFDPADESKLADFRNKIWPTVERMNAFAPQHSRLFKEMIIVPKPSKPFTYTAKSTARRQAIITDYEEEINALYDRVEESTQSSIPPPSSWDVGSTQSFVRDVVQSVLGHSVKDDDDLFVHGCDSLQATWIRNSIGRALKDSAKIDPREIGDNFVYSNPSISGLAAFVSRLVSGVANGTEFSVSAHVDAMRAMATKYSQNFPTHNASGAAHRQSGDIVLVTGTTGTLGSHILSKLVSNPDVSLIYAFNRASKDGTPLDRRQRDALIERGLDVKVLDGEKIILLEGDLNEKNFGLAENVYREVNSEVTHVIHNAWRVDFNVALTSFESNVKGLRKLIDFALTSPRFEPPHLSFTSTIGVLANPQDDGEQAEEPVEPEVAAGTGYTESKWVSEQLLLAVSSQTAFKGLIVRVGQICGGPDGAWNAHEWFPALVQSGARLGLFPSDNRIVTWIPPEIAADAIVDFRTAPETTRIVHLVHPRPVLWNTIADVVSSEVLAQLVPYSQWLSKLLDVSAQQSSEDGATQHSAGLEPVREIRALRLLPFFKRIAEQSNSGEAMGFPLFSVLKAKATSPTLANPSLRQLDADDVRRWISYWRRVGVFPAINGR